MEVTSPANVYWTTALIVALTIYLYHRRVTAWRVVPDNIPWVPSRLPWDSWLRNPLTRIAAHFSDLRGGTDLVKEGYGKVSLLTPDVEGAH